MEPINLHLEKLRLHRAEKDKAAPITEVLEEHLQDIWAISNQPGRQPMCPLLTSSHAIKIAAVEKANRFVAKQRRREPQAQAGAQGRRPWQGRTSIEA